MADKRKFSRVEFRTAATFVCKGDTTAVACETRDLGLGGVFVECAAPPTFGAEVSVHLQRGGDALVLSGVVRWLGPGGFGVQFGLLGARETHAITEIVRLAGAT